MNRSFIALSLLVLALLVAPAALASVPTTVTAAAQAAGTVDLATPGKLSFGPALAGNSVIYGSLDYTYDANANRYGHLHAWRSRPNAGATELAHFESSNVERRMDLAAGPEAFALGFSELDDCASSDIDSSVDGTCTVGSSSIVGPLTGGHPAPTCFPHIDRPNDLPASQFVQPLIAVSGPYFVRAHDASAGCGPQSRMVVSNALTSGDDSYLPLAAKSLLGVAINGSTLVLANRRSKNGFALVSYDLAKGRLNYQRIFSTPNFKYRVGLDVDRDGTVALAGQLRRNSRSSRPLCHTRQAVVLVDESGKPSCQLGRPATLEVKLASGTLLFYSGPGIKNSRSLLIAKDTENGKRSVLRSTKNWLHEPFDFDGKRLAWFDQTCAEPKLRLAEFTSSLSIDDPACTP
jgi:hypothetical protein